MSAIHNVFHVSELKKCVWVPTEVLIELEMEIEPDLAYEWHPIKIFDCKERSTHKRAIKIYKVQWSHHTEEEAMCKTEEYLNMNYLEFLPKNVGT
jgi:hypothetical protein